MIGTVIFALVRRKTADYLTENRNEKDKKITQTKDEFLFI